MLYSLGVGSMVWVRLLARLVVLVFLAIAAGACSIMPTSGPEIGEIS
jgi:hypothetical protein